jgi:hypothetical protein
MRLNDGKQSINVFYKQIIGFKDRRKVISIG